MGVITRSEGVLEPASSQLLSEVSIVARLAKAALDVDWSHLEADYGLIRKHIEHVIPGLRKVQRANRGEGVVPASEPRPRAPLEYRNGQSEFQSAPASATAARPMTSGS
jgi:hypothetical protein